MGEFKIICLFSYFFIKSFFFTKFSFSGGSMAKFINEEVPSISTQWEAWRLLFVDERMVPVNSEHSTLSLYLEGLVSKTDLTREKNFIEVDTALSGERQSLMDCHW